VVRGSEVYDIGNGSRACAKGLSSRVFNARSARVVNRQTDRSSRTFMEWANEEFNTMGVTFSGGHPVQMCGSPLLNKKHRDHEA